MILCRDGGNYDLKVRGSRGLRDCVKRFLLPAFSDLQKIPRVALQHPANPGESLEAGTLDKSSPQEAETLLGAPYAVGSFIPLWKQSEPT